MRGTPDRLLRFIMDGRIRRRGSIGREGFPGSGIYQGITAIYKNYLEVRERVKEKEREGEKESNSVFSLFLRGGEFLLKYIFK